MSGAILWDGQEDIYIKIPHKDLRDFLFPKQILYYCSGCPYLHVDINGLPNEMKRSEFIYTLKNRYMWSSKKEFETCLT